MQATPYAPAPADASNEYVTAEEYIGTDPENIDHGRLHIFKLANHLRGQMDPFAAMKRGWLESIEMFAGGLLAKAQFPRVGASA